MIALIRAWINYLWGKNRFKPVPRQIINDYDKRKQMTEAEQLLILKNKARSPLAAKILLKKHKTESAHDVIKALPKRRQATAKDRFMLVIQKIVGHDDRDPYRINLYEKDRLD